MQIIRIHHQLPDLRVLQTESHAQGFKFLDRLVKDFESGDNRFDRPGEALFGCFDGAECVAIGGINLSPRSGNLGVGRIRRVYVANGMRGNGVGKLIMSTLEYEAQNHFEALELFTDSPQAAAFYESLGYSCVNQVDSGGVRVSHRKSLV